LTNQTVNLMNEACLYFSQGTTVVETYSKRFIIGNIEIQRTTVNNELLIEHMEVVEDEKEI